MEKTADICRKAEEDALNRIKEQFWWSNSPLMARIVAETRAYYYAVLRNLSK